MLQYQSSDEALIGLLGQCRANGVYRKPAWQEFGCTEFPNPVLLKIQNPLERFCTIPERKANTALAVAESLWVTRGMNNLNALPGHYSKAVYAFADDGEHYRAGYGPRIRHFNGSSDQYTVGEYNKNEGGVDQLKYVVDLLTDDKETRQAVITIHDPNKDLFDESGKRLQTKDTPCTRSLHFMINNRGALDLTVHMRSNDIIRGFNAINVPLFTFLQQLVAQMIGVPLGSYYHVADSLHYYEIHEDLVSNLLAAKRPYVDMSGFSYNSEKLSLRSVDNAIDFLLAYEKAIREDENFTSPNPFTGYKELAVFEDYAEVFRAYWGKKAGLACDAESMFQHPQLKFIFGDK